MVTRHEFLAQLHEILNPKTYLEIGVQSGASLALAQNTKTAIGVDPTPALSVGIPFWAKVFEQTSDEFFALTAPEVLPKPVDLAFIDGMHLWEYALRDFMNIENYSSVETIVVFDDVLPYSQAIAARHQPPGDWTGDVWKLYYILTELRYDLDVWLVDTAPTGLMVVSCSDVGPGNKILPAAWPAINDCWSKTEEVPDEIINRSLAVKPDYLLDVFKIAKNWPTT